MLKSAYPPAMAFWPSVGMAAAVVALPLAGLPAYKLLFPADERRRGA